VRHVAGGLKRAPLPSLAVSHLMRPLSELSLQIIRDTGITINRPEARNAINSDVAQSLATVVAQTEQDPRVWVVILTGAGDGSSAPAFIEKRASRRTGA